MILPKMKKRMGLKTRYKPLRGDVVSDKYSGLLGVVESKKETKFHEVEIRITHSQTKEQEGEVVAKYSKDLSLVWRKE